jgi:serine/threonine-protein phosphatase 6 regulatory ankyrin repeat subunit B
MSKSNQLSNQLSQALAQQATLNDQLQKQVSISETFKHLFNSYRELKGIALNPLIVITKTISTEELAHTDVLKEASKSKHTAAFDLALAKITDLDYQDSDGKTVLMHAIINGFYYGVDKLLQRGADVNLIDKQSADALIYCAQISHIKYIKQIAEKTTDINYKAIGFGGNTALHLLVANTREIMFASELNNELQDANQVYIGGQKLVVVDADLTLAGLGGIRLSDGYTVNQEKTLRVIKFLTTKGADINNQNDQGQTPFFLVCIHQLKYLAHKLIDNYKLDFSLVDIHGYNILLWSLEIKDITLVKKIIEQGIDINQQDKQGNTALFWAAKYLLPDIVNLLFNTYDAIDIPNENGNTAWDIATLNSQRNLIDILITKKQVKLEAVKLWCAARNGNLEIVEQQIKQGADLNTSIANYADSTALIQAIAFGHFGIVSVLVNNGVDVNKADKDEVSPLYYSLGYAGQPIQPNIVKLLVSKGADVTQSMYDGDTPLHMACYRANTGAIKLLLDHGANIDTVNKQGKTSLHVLIEKKDIENQQKLTALKYLLAKSASTTLKNSEGRDAIDLAKDNFPEALPWLEHPEHLPPLSEFEATIIGLTDFVN